MQKVNRGMQEDHVHPRHFPLPYAHTPYIHAHTTNWRDTMDMDDIAFYGIMAALFAVTLAVGILAALHETALLAGGV